MEKASREFTIAELIYAARIMTDGGFLPATDGNLSARLEDERVLLTASGVEKRNLSADLLVELKLDQLSDPRGSSEWLLHRALYLSRPDVNAVLHGHCPYLTTFAVCGRVPDVGLLAEAKMILGEIVLVPFCEPGTPAVGEIAVAKSRTATVYLLANHGAVAVGANVREALHRLERAEFLARIAWQSEFLGGGVPLTGGPEIASLNFNSQERPC